MSSLNKALLQFRLALLKAACHLPVWQQGLRWVIRCNSFHFAE